MATEAKHVVMVVEDDADTRDALCEALEVFGFECLTAVNGEEALRKLETARKPCIILLDLMMPVMDGWEFRAVQRNTASISSIPVVCLTANLAAADQALESGCVAFLPKPIEMDALLETIREYCA